MNRVEILLGLVIGVCTSLIGNLIWSLFPKKRYRRTSKQLFKETKQAINYAKVTRVIASYALKNQLHSLKSHLVSNFITASLLFSLMWFGAFDSVKYRRVPTPNLIPSDDIIKRRNEPAVIDNELIIPTNMDGPSAITVEECDDRVKGLECTNILKVKPKSVLPRNRGKTRKPFNYKSLNSTLLSDFLA